MNDSMLFFTFCFQRFHYFLFLSACVCVFLFLIHIENQWTPSTSKVKASLEGEDSLVDPQRFKGLIEGQDLVLWFRLGLVLINASM